MKRTSRRTIKTFDPIKKNLSKQQRVQSQYATKTSKKKLRIETAKAYLSGIIESPCANKDGGYIDGLDPCMVTWNRKLSEDMLVAMLETEHRDGNPYNDSFDNLFPVCGCCHDAKTYLSEDNKTHPDADYKTLKIKEKIEEEFKLYYHQKQWSKIIFRPGERTLTYNVESIFGPVGAGKTKLLMHAIQTGLFLREMENGDFTKKVYDQSITITVMPSRDIQGQQIKSLKRLPKGSVIVTSESQEGTVHQNQQNNQQNIPVLVYKNGYKKDFIKSIKKYKHVHAFFCQEMFKSFCENMKYIYSDLQENELMLNVIIDEGHRNNHTLNKENTVASIGRRTPFSETTRKAFDSLNEWIESNENVVARGVTFSATPSGEQRDWCKGDYFIQSLNENCVDYRDLNHKKIKIVDEFGTVKSFIDEGGLQTMIDLPGLKMLYGRTPRGGTNWSKGLTQDEALIEIQKRLTPDNDDQQIYVPKSSGSYLYKCKDLRLAYAQGVEPDMIEEGEGKGKVKIKRKVVIDEYWLRKHRDAGTPVSFMICNQMFQQGWDYSDITAVVWLRTMSNQHKPIWIGPNQAYGRMVRPSDLYSHGFAFFIQEIHTGSGVSNVKKNIQKYDPDRDRDITSALVEDCVAQWVQEGTLKENLSQYKAEDDDWWFMLEFTAVRFYNSRVKVPMEKDITLYCDYGRRSFLSALQYKTSVSVQEPFYCPTTIPYIQILNELTKVISESKGGPVHSYIECNIKRRI